MRPLSGQADGAGRDVATEDREACLGPRPHVMACATTRNTDRRARYFRVCSQKIDQARRGRAFLPWHVARLIACLPIGRIGVVEWWSGGGMISVCRRCESRYGIGTRGPVAASRCAPHSWRCIWLLAHHSITPILQHSGSPLLHHSVLSHLPIYQLHHSRRACGQVRVVRGHNQGRLLLGAQAAEQFDNLLASG